MAELRTHSKRDSLWICVSGKCYDITPYLEKHPGGQGAILNMAGKDVTDAFANYHPDYVYRKILPSF